MLKPPAVAAPAAACCLPPAQLKVGMGINSCYSLGGALNLLYY